MRMRLFLLGMIMCCMIGGAQSAYGQSFIGLGLGAGLPQTQFVDQSNLGLHGELQYGLHRYCKLWPVFTVNYGNYQPIDSLEYTSPRIYSLPHVLNVQANVRWFPWGAPTVPLYLGIGTGLSVIVGKDKEGKVGMPGTIEAGYLFNYENPCCDWFITLSARYTTNNMLRDKDRPNLSSLAGMVHFSIPLGGK